MSEARKTNGASRIDRRAHGAEWAVGLAAAALLLISVGGYLYHREQLASIAVEHIRLRVCLPPSLGKGRPAEFHVFTTGLTGEPAVAQVEIGLLSPDGEPILHLTDHTSAEGRLSVVIPAQDDLPNQGVQIEVTAGRNGSRETFETRLAVEPVRYRTCLATDRPTYRPGNTIRYRSVTLTSFDLAVAPEQAVEFEFQDADGRRVPESEHKVRTVQGLGHGEFPLPADFSDGEITLVARSPNRRFPEVRLPVTVGGNDTASTAADGAEESDELQVEFYPESGVLVPKLENRVYFAARNSGGEPIDLKGLVVDADGTPVAIAETIRSGMGVFNFRPKPGGRYRLRIGEPSDVELEPELPEVDPRGNVVLSTGIGVFEAGKPLELNLRAAEDGIPLVVSAWCRGVPVAQQPVVARVLDDNEPQEDVPGAGGVNQVSLDLPDTVGGLIRLTVYDYSVNPPQPVAERSVYRRPRGRLEVTAVAEVERANSNKRATVSLRVTDESGNPTQAMLAISAVDRAMIGPADHRAVSLPACFLLAQLADRAFPPALVALDTSGNAEADVALDLLLGTYGRPITNETSEESSDDAELFGAFDAGPPPVVFDNLLPLQQEYEQAIVRYRRDRTRTLDTLTTLSFFGGFGLVLAVAMLGFLGVVSGLRLWIPAGGTAICCLLIGAILLSPLRSGQPPVSSVGYLSFEESALDDDAPLPAEERPTNQTPQGAPRPPIFAYSRQVDEAGQWSESSGTLLWDHLLVVDKDGRAEVTFDLPDAVDDLCLRVAAYGEGRLGEVRTCLENADAIY